MHDLHSLQSARSAFWGDPLYTPEAIPFFFFVSCRMRFLILGRSVGKEKKKTKIKLKRSLELDGLVPQHNIREAWKQQGVVAKSTWRQW